MINEHARYPISRQVSRQEARVLAKIAQYARTKFSPTNVRHVEVDIKGRSKYWPHCGKKEIERGKRQLLMRDSFYYSLPRDQRRSVRRTGIEYPLGLGWPIGSQPSAAQMGE